MITSGPLGAFFGEKLMLSVVPVVAPLLPLLRLVGRVLIGVFQPAVGVGNSSSVVIVGEIESRCAGVARVHDVDPSDQNEIVGAAGE